MKTSDTTGIFRPFEELKDLLEKKSLKPRPFPDDKSSKVTGETRVKKTGVLKSPGKLELKKTVFSSLIAP